MTSTCVSCYLACQIEVGAHRLVYKFFPEKYANVNYANGLTQEQLDAARNVKVMAAPFVVVAAAVLRSEESGDMIEVKEEDGTK